jgi:glycosyltransferase involved in cell wall biosynthesis
MPLSHLHFVQSLEPLQGGGLGGAALGLHLALRGLGDASRLVATRDAAFAPAWPDVTQVVRRGPAKAYYSPELKRLARELTGHADVVHGHGFYVYPNCVFGREARRTGKPLVYHVQGFLDPWILQRSRLKKRIAHWWFEDANFRHARLWRALSSKEADQIRAAGIKGPIVVLPNGILLEEMDRAAGAMPGLPHLQRARPHRILLLSRIHPKKGLDLMVRAWARLRGEFPDWEVTAVGPDEQGYQAAVESLIREAGLTETFRVFPAVSGDAKNAVLGSADVFALPSYSEGFPVAVLEAAAHRLPVVMTTECNFPELAAAGGAWLCEPEAESVEQALRAALAAGEAERRQRGEAGRRLVEARYTWQRIAAELSVACADILRGPALRG